MNDKKHVVVLGCGRVGRTISEDLSLRHRVTVVDASCEALETFQKPSHMCETKLVHADVTDLTKLTSIVNDADAVVNAVPGSMGYLTLQLLLSLCRDIVDISFMEEDVMTLDERARDVGVTAIVDCGIAPGCWNMFVGRALSEMDRVDSATCYVGGLPTKPTMPWQYKAGYSPYDVLEMYTRKARIKHRGKIVEVEPMSDVHRMKVPGFDASLEAFSTDGLRTLEKTVDVPNMRELTLRYPGHLDLIKKYRDIGMFSKDAVEVVADRSKFTGKPLSRAHVRPIDLFAALVFDKWTFDEAEQDVTLMHVVIEGVYDGNPSTLTHSLVDFAVDRNTSMARTTGFTCVAAVEALLAGKVSRKGIVPPELLGRDIEVHNFILNELRERDVRFDTRVTSKR